MDGVMAAFAVVLKSPCLVHVSLVGVWIPKMESLDLPLSCATSFAITTVLIDRTSSKLTK